MGEDRAIPTAVEVAVVGDGFSGIGMAIRLKKLGIDDFVVLDRGSDVGGTWRDNSYPGAACDVPSQLYSFSFALNPDWSRAFSPQPEIQQYLRRCVADFGVADHFCFDAEVHEAGFDADTERWTLKTARGELTARVVVWATGSLSEPRLPDLPGLGGFSGTVFHTAQWDHDYDLAGKRVAVVGTGASAIQLVPAIAGQVDQLTLFQRTPAWVLPRRDHPISSRAAWWYRHVPPVQRMARGLVYWSFELLMMPALTGQNLRRRTFLTKAARANLRRGVSDPELRAALRPSFELGCKRVLISDDYYPALVRDNVEVVTAAVERFDAGAVVAADGSVHRVDAVIFATGFDAAEPPYGSRIVGRDGRRLSEHWAAEGTSAYVGSTVAGFPNLFLMVGPNTTLGHNSVVFMIESQLNYVAGAVEHLRRTGAGTIEVRPVVQARYNEDLQAKMVGTVWMNGGCSSWYLDHRGRNTTLWPDHTMAFRRATRRFNPADHVIRAAGGDPAPQRPSQVEVAP